MTSGEPTTTFLAHFSGPDGPGLTAAITAILAGHKCRILDIGQAVVHENLALGILVEVIDAAEVAGLRSTLHDRAHKLGLATRFATVTADALAHWSHSLHRHHLIVTVLGRRLDARHVSRISETLTAKGMNIDRIERLSDELSPEDAQPGACIEFGVSGDPAQEAALRAEFLRCRGRASSGVTGGCLPSTWTRR
jgi:phosphoserine phosphatase